MFGALPSLAGRSVLDLGCGPGEQAAELVRRGARVVGIDMNASVIAEARARRLPNAEFRVADLRALDLSETFDGIWCRFAAAYFPHDLAAVLPSWLRHLKRGGWAAFIEIDDLFGHEPLSEHAKAQFAAYAEEALAAGRYDFHMGHKLAGFLERAGLRVESFTIEDRELSFDGPADADVLESWDRRFGRMQALAHLRDEFLACLRAPDHRSTAKVYCAIGFADA